MTPKFSIIIPVRVVTSYLKQTLNKLSLQEFKSFEVIVITDADVPHPSDPLELSPAFKRNLAASRAKGKYLAFLDDDSYPDSLWLASAYKILKSNNNYAAVCGPALTPPDDNILKQSSGLVWASLIGSGGAGTYRNSKSAKRFVSDYPTVNFIIKKEVFDKLSGFNLQYWPGEDTLLCRDIISKTDYKILYHPNIVVYHHRRSVIIPHLQQITRYALHRGFFARKFPENSRSIGYFLPSLFLIYNTFLLLYLILNTEYLILLIFPLLIYLSLLLINAIYFIIKRQNLFSVLLFIITVPLTHLYYGYLFIVGFLTHDLKSRPHSLNSQKNQYLGG